MITCAVCGKKLREPTEEERRAMWKEHDENFPLMSHKTAVDVCDDCYHEMISQKHSHAWMREEAEKQ